MCVSDGCGSSHPSPWRRHTYSRCEIGCLAAAPASENGDHQMLPLTLTHLGNPKASAMVGRDLLTKMRPLKIESERCWGIHSRLGTTSRRFVSMMECGQTDLNFRYDGAQKPAGHAGGNHAHLSSPRGLQVGCAISSATSSHLLALNALHLYSIRRLAFHTPISLYNRSRKRRQLVG